MSRKHFGRPESRRSRQSYLVELSDVLGMLNCLITVGRNSSLYPIAVMREVVRCILRG